MTIRIVVADDHPVVRDGLRAILATEPDLQVVGEATTGSEAVTLVEELRPDLVLMDLQMPGHRRRGRDQHDPQPAPRGARAGPDHL